MVGLHVVDGILRFEDEGRVRRVDNITRLDGGGVDCFRVEVVGGEVHLYRDMQAVIDDGSRRPAITLKVADDGAVTGEVPGGYCWTCYGPVLDEPK